ncbi:unnamed protein product [Calicophoron daubneyi]|uniref:Uncharacterized protein n=1 Tax=Calicophoron daubneyi TaxID=300641 RepID=A0AAV2TWD6_CALDB
MNYFRNFLFLASVALMSSHTAANPTEYEIPGAKRDPQVFFLEGGSMNGSKLLYNNSRMDSVNFNFTEEYLYGQNATITYSSGGMEATYKLPFEVSVTQGYATFTLTGNWTSNDAGVATYYAPNGTPEGDNDRNATNLSVEGSYSIEKIKNATQRIWAHGDCSIHVSMSYPSGLTPDGCKVTLKFSGIRDVDANNPDETLTSVSIPMIFATETTCTGGFVKFFYVEDCPSTTTTGAPQTTTPKSAATSGFNAMAHSLLITTALALTMVHW